MVPSVDSLRSSSRKASGWSFSRILRRETLRKTLIFEGVEALSQALEHRTRPSRPAETFGELVGSLSKQQRAHDSWLRFPPIPSTEDSESVTMRRIRESAPWHVACWEKEW